MIDSFAMIIPLILIALPIAWLVSEFGQRRTLRIALGLATIVTPMVVAYHLGGMSRLSYNIWYGAASKDLIDTTVTQIEDGNIDRVMSVLRRLNLDYQPTYENRAHYDEQVREAVSQMKGTHELQDTKWEPSPFTRDTWLGHWENDTGFWIVVNHKRDLDAAGPTLDVAVVLYGDDMPEMTNLEATDEFRTLSFTEGDRWRHELTLNNKYEATHVRRDLANNSVWRTDTLHKLRRTTPDERAFTQQDE